jgi:hypothetical protein
MPSPDSDFDEGGAPQDDRELDFFDAAMRGPQPPRPMTASQLQEDARRANACDRILARVSPTEASSGAGSQGDALYDVCADAALQPDDELFGRLPYNDTDALVRACGLEGAKRCGRRYGLMRGAGSDAAVMSCEGAALEAACPIGGDRDFNLNPGEEELFGAHLYARDPDRCYCACLSFCQTPSTQLFSAVQLPMLRDPAYCSVASARAGLCRREKMS